MEYAPQSRYIFRKLCLQSFSWKFVPKKLFLKVCFLGESRSVLIGELAKQSNLSKDTIRFYEKIGLLSAGERRAGSRVYKEFPPHTLMRLQLIRQAKKLGFTLSEIKGALDSWEDGSLSYQEKIEIMEDKIRDIDAQIADLETVKDYLKEKKILLLKMAEEAI